MTTKLIKSAVAGLAMLGAVGAAQATLVLPGSETPLQTVINNLYSCGTCSPVANAPDVNANQHSPDSIWAIEATGTAVATFIIEIAGNSATNSFGMYDINNGNQVQLFSGPADSADRATVSLFTDGSLVVTFIPFAPDPDAGAVVPTITPYAAGYFTGNNFGFYLGTGSGTFYSEASKNPGGEDQMVAFKGDGDTIQLPGANAGVWGPSSFILAWEDITYRSSDKDFNDLVVYVESITAVPEPGVLGLLGLGLAGLGFFGRRRRA